MPASHANAKPLRCLTPRAALGSHAALLAVLAVLLAGAVPLVHAPAALAQESQDASGEVSSDEDASKETTEIETGFATADGFAELPLTAAMPRMRPSDPEDREDEEGGTENASGDGTAPDPDAGGTDDDAKAPRTAVAGDSPDPSDTPPVFRMLAETDEEFAACTARLEALGTAFEPVDPITEGKDPDCGIARPIAVSEIVPGVALRPDAVMRCRTARALAEWVSEAVVPAAAELPERGALAGVEHGSTYICRRRNNAATGKLSEHSFGNGIDVMGFRFESGDPLPIEPRAAGNPAAKFQRTVRKASCEHFTTVLGPGSNAAHANHLHLDVKERRGGYRLCE